MKFIDLYDKIIVSSGTYTFQTADGFCKVVLDGELVVTRSSCVARSSYVAEWKAQNNFYFKRYFDDTRDYYESDEGRFFFEDELIQLPWRPA